MDDTCIICAESLEWVAYGACGHREVCSTCVVRMRFVLEDRRCCLCKIESPAVFVTKAMGDYTRVITDFSQFPSGPSEGQVGNFWYHEDTQAYFDDRAQYQMIKAMCRLSCSVCERSEEEADGGGKRRSRFRNIDQLKNHLFHRHKLFMCSLCLEGRKVFICEQKLYTKAQLKRHISGGDPEVDGTESERGGFKGHPTCEFCRTPFYGENELYTHMSTEHYTCHICQRQHPGQYDYFRNYDDLETHFRQEHFLCENEACLAKKFIVFPSESELKRHNAVEHGGSMSRSKRNAALQIPTSFRYRRAADLEQRRGRGHGHGHGHAPRHESSDSQLAMAIQASFESATTTDTSQAQARPVLPTEGAPSLRTVNGSNSAAQSARDSSSPPIIEESSFPPLSDRDPPEASSRYAHALVQGPGLPSRLGGEAFPPLPGAPEPAQLKPSLQSSKPTIAAHIRHRNAVVVRPAPSRNARPSPPMNSTQLWPTPAQEFTPSKPSSSRSTSQPRATFSDQNKPVDKNKPPISNLTSGGSGSSSSGKGMNHSSSAPDLRVAEEENIRAANKALVDRIREDLGMDEEKFSAFKHISAEFRQGLSDSQEYLSYVEQFGLLHLVPELARLCPDPEKQRDLLSSFSARTGAIKKQQAKGKGKSIPTPPAPASSNSLADGILEAVRKLQSNYRPEEGVEVLSKDGYRAAHSKQTQKQHATEVAGGDNQASNRQRPKKVSKFHRVRLGVDGSVLAEQVEEEPAAINGGEGIPVRGVWKNGAGQKLFSSANRTR
ncbi:uncharacterized protein LOC144715581 [Wolffia australiana]